MGREIKELYDDTGRKVSEIEMLDGKAHGVTRVWHVEGVLTIEAEMEFGEYHGRYASWWYNGKKKEEGQFYRGTRVGLYRWFSESGALIKEEDYGPGVL